MRYPCPRNPDPEEGTCPLDPVNNTLECDAAVRDRAGRSRLIITPVAGTYHGPGPESPWTLPAGSRFSSPRARTARSSGGSAKICAAPPNDTLSPR